MIQLLIHLMGWESSNDTLSELKNGIYNKDLAIEYAKKIKLNTN